jgi:outer membrane protein TolC
VYLRRLIVGFTIGLFFPTCASAQEISSALTLQQAVEKALANHPEILAAAARVKGSAGLEMQARLRPNPAFTFQTENWRFSDTPSFRAGQDLDIYAYLSQPIELGGKRQRRMELSGKDAAQIELERKGAEWKIRQEVKRSFLRALQSQRDLELAAAISKDFQEVIEYHRKRFEEGALAEADLIKVRLEGERLALAESAAALEDERNHLDLLRTMGVQESHRKLQLVDSEGPAPSTGNLEREQFFERARSNRWEVQAARLQVERARSSLAMEKSLGSPDLNAILGYKRTGGLDTLVAGIMVPLPFFHRNQGAILQSGTEITRAQELLRSITIQVEAEVAQALSVLRRRFAMLQQMQKGMVERAEQSWRIALAAYQEGGFDLVRLLDAQRSKNEVQLLYSRTSLEYRINLIDLESALGEENLPVSEVFLSSKD